MTEAAAALAGATVALDPGDGAFIDLYAGIIDPPTVGQNLLGQQTFTRAIGTLGPGSGGADRDVHGPAVASRHRLETQPASSTA